MCYSRYLRGAHPIIDAGTVADLRGDSTHALLGKTAGLCASHCYFDSQRDGTGWAHRLARSGDVGHLFFGITTALTVAALVGRMSNEDRTGQPFILELPAYRLPVTRTIVKTALNRAGHFVQKAGSVIFAVTVVVWILGYFPNGGQDLSSSWLASIGRFMSRFSLLA